jgi:hypothetical protein
MIKSQNMNTSSLSGFSCFFDPTFLRQGQLSGFPRGGRWPSELRGRTEVMPPSFDDYFDSVQQFIAEFAVESFPRQSKRQSPVTLFRPKCSTVCGWNFACARPVAIL